jgi:hypothetical protein
MADVKSALGALAGTVFAKTDAGEAESLMQFIASSDLEEGVLALISLAVRAGRGGAVTTAALQLVAAYTESLGLHSRLRLMADQVDMIDGDGNVFPALLAALTGEYDTPIVSGQISVDLSKRRISYGVVVDEDCELQFPLGAYDGAVARVGFYITGNYTLTLDLAVYAAEGQPDWPTTTGAFVDAEIRVKTVQPPVAFFRILSVGATNLSSNRRLSITPAPFGDGKTIWDLDFDGPIDLRYVGPGTYTITALGNYIDATWDFWGPGGSSGAGGNASHTSATDGQPGTDTTFAGSIVAGAGQPSIGVRVNDSNRDGRTNGAAGGTASGGDVNTAGNAGGNGTWGGISTTIKGGDGAAAPNGGLVKTGTTFSQNGAPSGTAGSLTVANGAVGNGPGGGASGPVSVSYDLGSDETTSVGWIAIGGGGSGGRVTWSTGADDLVHGVSYTLVIGDSGAAGVSSGDANMGPGGFQSRVKPSQGARGAPGGAYIQ